MRFELFRGNTWSHDTVEYIFHLMAEVKENHKEASGQAYYVVLPLLWDGSYNKTVIKRGYELLAHTYTVALPL